MGAGRARKGCGSASGAFAPAIRTLAFAQQSGSRRGAQEEALVPADLIGSWPHSSTGNPGRPSSARRGQGRSTTRNWSMDNLPNSASTTVFWDGIPQPPPLDVVLARYQAWRSKYLLPPLRPGVTATASHIPERQRSVPRTGAASCSSSAPFAQLLTRT